MDLRNTSKYGWVAVKDDHHSLYHNSNVVADIEYYTAAYWRIVYYRSYQGRTKLQFAFEDCQKSAAEIRMMVETRVKQERIFSTPISNELSTS